MIKIDNIKDLQHLDKEVRRVITKHIKSIGETPSGFANSVGIHPLQMLRYVNDGKNFQIGTLVNIGKRAKLKP